MDVWLHFDDAANASVNSIYIYKNVNICDDDDLFLYLSCSSLLHMYMIIINVEFAMVFLDF